jgi:predicted N-formylglutamate amidohydrolase
MSFLQFDDPTPVSSLEVPFPAWPALLVCDHASPAIPRSLGSLGLDRRQIQQHIGWDIGAADLAIYIGTVLRLPVICSGYSRLVVDCNRHLEDPSAFPAISDGVRIPGNEGLTSELQRLRAAACYWPYHRAIGSALEKMAQQGRQASLIAIHSYTPALRGGPQRPWHVGVLWDRDARLAEPLLQRLREHPNLVVGDNQPYSGRDPPGYTVQQHGEARGLPHVSLEIRQDLIDHAEGVQYWGGLIAAVLASILASADVNQRTNSSP